MKNKIDLLNIEVGTFRRENDKLLIELNKSQFRYDNLSELNQMKKDAPHFLKLVNILEKDESVELTYVIPQEAKSLKKIGLENKAIRSSIAKAIIDTDIESIDYHVSLNPANVWYYPMSNIWYTYRASEEMPYNDSQNRFMEYKALVLYVLTGIPFERLTTDMAEATQKVDDELIKQVINSESINDLRRTITSINDYVQAEEWKSVDNNQKKMKHRSYLTIAGIAVIAVLAVGLVHKSGEKKIQATEEQNKKQLTAVQYRNQLNSSIQSKDWKEATEAMNKLGYSKDKQVSKYLSLNQYEQALNVDSKSLNKVIAKAYANDDSKTILDWKLPVKASTQQKDALKLEKEIITYDQSALVNELPFNENGSVLLRMGQAFISHDDEQDATTTQNKLIAINKDKGRYLQALIKQHQLQATLKDAQKKLDDAKKIDDKDKSKGDKVKEAQGNYDSAKRDLQDADSKVKEAQRKVG